MASGRLGNGNAAALKRCVAAQTKPVRGSLQAVPDPVLPVESEQADGISLGDWWRLMQLEKCHATSPNRASVSGIKPSSHTSIHM